MTANVFIKLLRRWSLLALAPLALGFAMPVASAADAANKLEAVDVQTLPGQQLQVTLRMANPAPQPLSFTIDNPARISFDLPGTTLALPSRRIDVRASGVDSIVAAEAAGRTRLVLNLDRLMPYQTRVEGNNIVVMVGAAVAQQAVTGGKAAAAAGAERRSASTTPAASGAPGRAIKSIDFRRGGDGTGRIIVSLTDPRTPINLRPQGNQIVVDFAGADLPARLARRYDAMDFATPVSSFDAVRVSDGTRLVINASGDFEQLAYQSDDQYVIEVQPARKVQAQAEEKRQYTGEKLNLNFQDIETLLQSWHGVARPQVLEPLAHPIGPRLIHRRFAGAYHAAHMAQGAQTLQSNRQQIDSQGLNLLKQRQENQERVATCARCRQDRGHQQHRRDKE